ncbi:hypothetical protein B0H14DRAFT_3145267 [Mycena olivaceomarginata]|nr:hypothetical protein B0H14DRAFT_3731076 [Mycena olivaceomarginata]KAJ7825542.1 hypothetical protein B0H14DRAFT_3145267 [Mycena olivaceomarginata]
MSIITLVIFSSFSPMSLAIGVPMRTAISLSAPRFTTHWPNLRDLRDDRDVDFSDTDNFDSVRIHDSLLPHDTAQPGFHRNGGAPPQSNGVPVPGSMTCTSAHNTLLRLHGHVSAPPGQPNTVTVLNLVQQTASASPSQGHPPSRRCVCVSEKRPGKTRISSTVSCAARTAFRATERLVLPILQSLDAGDLRSVTTIYSWWHIHWEVSIEAIG